MPSAARLPVSLMFVVPVATNLGDGDVLLDFLVALAGVKKGLFHVFHAGAVLFQFPTQPLRFAAQTLLFLAFLFHLRLHLFQIAALVSNLPGGSGGVSGRKREKQEENERRWEFLGELPRMRREDNLLFVHGSARNPLNEYVFPEDIYNQRKMERIFALVDRYCFQGHTHIPGIFREDLSFLSPEEVDMHYELSDAKTLINVGSVGQPRDGDPVLAGAHGLNQDHVEADSVEQVDDISGR